MQKTSIGFSPCGTPAFHNLALGRFGAVSTGLGFAFWRIWVSTVCILTFWTISGSGVCILDVFYRFLFWFFSNVHSLILAEDTLVQGTYEISYCKMMQRHSAVPLHHANQKFIGAAQGVFTVWGWKLHWVASLFSMCSQTRTPKKVPCESKNGPSLLYGF